MDLLILFLVFLLCLMKCKIMKKKKREPERICILMLFTFNIFSCVSVCDAHSIQVQYAIYADILVIRVLYLCMCISNEMVLNARFPTSTPCKE